MKSLTLKTNLSLTLITIAFLVGSTLVSTLLFNGYSESDNYAIKNFLISELGNKHKSPLFLLFNTSLIVSGIFLLIITIKDLNFSFVIKSSLLLSAIGLIGVGLFPEHYSVKGHLISASIFFGSSACAISKATYEYIRMDMTFKRRTLIILGLITLFVFANIYLEPKTLLIELITLKENFVRPKIWKLAILEWSYVCLFIIWFFILQINEEETKH